MPAFADQQNGVHKMAEGQPGQGYTVGASEYGGPGDPTSGSVGSCGHSLHGRMAFAELLNGTALGSLPCGTKIEMESIGGRGGTIRAEKLDIGLGGANVEGKVRRVDLWWETARAMGLPGNGKWTGVIRIRRADGRPISGPGLKEHAGENIHESGPFTEGETSAAEKAVSSVTSWTKDLASVLSFLGSGAGWARIGKVALGGVIALIALNELVKAGSQNTAPGIVKRTVGATPAGAAAGIGKTKDATNTAIEGANLG